MNKMNNIKQIVEAELSALDRAIDYADDNSVNRNYQFHDPSIIDSLLKIHAGQQSAYKEFLRVAWGKAIRIKTERKGEVVYRLSQAAAIIPGLDIATPQSPIGRLVNIARAGDIYESSILGEYSIEDVWYFERFVANEYLENLKNFKKMTSKGSNVFSIDNLLDWLKNYGKRSSITMEEDERGADATSLWDEVTFESSEDEEEEEPIEIVEETEEQKGISLPTGFYVNLSAHQYDAAHSGANGLVFVFGVAGSGKTSVALGRSKSLAQLGQLPKDDRLYNQDFPEETQIGIVRTGELISYLKNTCNMLSLHRLPVVEYREIHEELKAHWDIEQSKHNNKGPKYFLAQKNNNSDIETRAKWFHFISEKMLEVFSQQAVRLINNIPRSVSSIDGDIFIKINEILSADIAQSLKSTDPLGFLLRVEDSIKKSFDKLFSQTAWIGIPRGNDNIVWLNEKHHNIAAHLSNKEKVLCLFVSARNVQIIIPKAKIDNWEKWIPDGTTRPPQAGNKVPDYISFSLADGNTIDVKVILASDAELVQYAKDGSLRFYEGIGERTQTVRTRKLWLAHMPRIVASNEHSEGAEKNTREWRTKVRNRVLANIQKSLNIIPADLFSKTIHYLVEKHHDEYALLLKNKQQQISGNKLSESDIDLLIAFMASITRGMNKDSPFISGIQIKPTPYRSSVFIDEVQDFSEIQIFLLSLLADPKYNSVTAVGDAAQCLYRIESDITVSFPSQTWQGAKKQELTENIRQQHVPTINALSSAFRNKYIDDVLINTGDYIRNENLSAFHEAGSINQLRQAYKIISIINRKESVVIVVPSIDRAKETIEKLKPHLRERQHRECRYSNTIDLSKKYIAHVTTPRNIKGLEFDHLIALYLDEYNLSSANNRNALYVMLSRPKNELYLIGDFEKIRDDFKVLVEKFADIQKT
ncbi:MAG: AAA family ATPase [Candidatus Thiocaldithrix dubininis]|uniref:DNA 3'-5' helicase II n=1 Tax=Candidatus Thiocaldithrix dubininis TaxID=3080823 RepID=A0AA95H513_9GAMM|nr:MAG: AAA family ATPase [Candidatus Thiocaldithrix dubininis]